MEKFVILTALALCCIFNRTISAPIIKASGVQWSEPKGTGKGNITLIMIPQNNSCDNDTDMIVAVKSDYQIVSQDTQLLNLVVNENTNNKTSSLKSSTPLQKCTALKEEIVNKKEREILRNPNTAKYFESENKLPSENTTNNTVNIYPLLIKNYKNLVALDGTSTPTAYNTVNVFQLLNMSAPNNNYESLNNLKVSNYSNVNTATSEHSYVNLTEPNNRSVTQDIFKSNSDNITPALVGSDDNFLNEALNILEKLKHDPSYYNKLKSNQIPSAEETKERGDISLADSKTKLVKSYDLDLASDEGEGLSQELGQTNHEGQDISNLEGKVNEKTPSSTCLPFFMSLSSEQTMTQPIDANSPIELSLEKIPLRGTASNVSQEFTVQDNSSSLYKNVSLSSKCKPLVPSNILETTSQTTKTPVEIYINSSVGYGVQSNDSSQNMYIKNCGSSNGLGMESGNFTPPTIATRQAEYEVSAAESVTGISIGKPNYLLQTLAAGKMASGSELSITDLSYVSVTTSIPISEYKSYLSKESTECSTSASGVGIVPPNLEQSNKAQPAGHMMSSAIPNNQDLIVSEPNITATKTDSIDKSLQQRLGVLLNESTSPNLPRQNQLEIQSTECISNTCFQTVSPIVGTINVGAGLHGLSEIKTECATDPNIKQNSSLPQAGVGAVPKKITLEPQISCGTGKKEEFSTLSHIEGEAAIFKDRDLTLPLVRSSIFLVNNNEMSRGKDIPIYLNASLDEYSMSDLQEKEDRIHGKVAELYNQKPIVLFNVERDPAGTLLKPPPKYYKSVILKSPSLYFDKIHNPDSNEILKMNVDEKNANLDQRPSYKYEANNRVCNNILQDTNYETDSVVNDSIKQEPIAMTTQQTIISLNSNAYGGSEHNYLVTTVELPYSQQASKDEERLLTILNTIDETTLGINYKDTQGNLTLLDVPTFIPNNNIVSIPMPVNDDDKVLKPQKSGQNITNAGSNLGQEDSENNNSQLNSQNRFATKLPLRNEPADKLPGRLCSKSHRTKNSTLKTVPELSRTSFRGKIVQEKIASATEKLCIPAYSLQKIVIEIVRNTNKPENKRDSYRVNKDKSVQIKGVKKEETHSCPIEEIRAIKQNVIPFQSAWKPVQTIEKQQILPPSVSLKQNSDYSNENTKDRLKTKMNKYNGVQENQFQNKNNDLSDKNQNIFHQEENPTNTKYYNSPFHRTATTHEKSLGANILKLLMSDKAVG